MIYFILFFKQNVKLSQQTKRDSVPNKYRTGFSLWCHQEVVYLLTCTRVGITCTLVGILVFRCEKLR